MFLPVQLILFSIPSLIYFLIKRKKIGNKTSLHFLGFTSAAKIYYFYAILGFLLCSLLGFLAITFSKIDPTALEHTNFAHYQNYTFGFSVLLLIFLKEAFINTLGEEILFRGFLGGIFFRKYKFLWANLFQTLIFLLPHLILLFASVKFTLYMLPVIFVAGWIGGWLRFKSNSILPGWLMHALVNTFSAVLVLLDL